MFFNLKGVHYCHLRMLNSLEIASISLYFSFYKPRDYQQRLSKLELTNPRTRRLRGDLIQMYKLFIMSDKSNFYGTDAFNESF
ncbi:hypothetical protein BpHYR1_052371 [Brachionus plicatilis]|uniref:Uncharacterized protein n=1 Tax=Brachionus plicatilis TaxID=10195 RepID=A0A3M7QS73_BRAPC|nr:hypothetical protein BpHYR1_052371 [Brachionus plicatilis]